MSSRTAQLKTEDPLTERIATRLYIADELAPAASVPLGASAAHRLRDVLRLAPGNFIAGFNERDGEWLCRIDELARSHAVLCAQEQRRRPEPEPDLWLLFAPIKRARLDWLVEKAVELGVAALVPVITARTQPERLNPDRLRALAVAAAEQCERLSIPEIRPVAPFERIVTGWPADRHLVVCDESGTGTPIAAALAGFPSGSPAAVFVGPEGGFAETDLDALDKLPIVTRVGLGPRVLRAETAAVAALSVFQAIAGDWRRRRLR